MYHELPDVEDVEGDVVVDEEECHGDVEVCKGEIEENVGFNSVEEVEVGEGEIDLVDEDNEGDGEEDTTKEKELGTGRLPG